MKKLLLIAWVSLTINTHAQTISTYAGTGTQGYTGDLGQATAAEISTQYVAIDTAGNIYIADIMNNFIRKVNMKTGIITTVAGNGTGGYNGDGIAATSAELYQPMALAVDISGNVYIADAMNARIRKVNASTGYITTIAGDGTGGYGGDGAAATSAEIWTPQGVAVDSLGNIYIADSFNNRIRKVNSSGTITTIAGNGTAGFNGDNGLATSAELNNPVGVCMGLKGSLYFSDGNRVRMVTATDTIKTIAGNGLTGNSGDGGNATAAELSSPLGVFVDKSGNIYISDNGSNVIRKVTYSTGIINTIAGNGTQGYNGDGIPATTAELFNPGCAVLDASGNVYISDNGNHRIRKVSSPLGINEISEISNVILFPNPNSGLFNIGLQNLSGKYKMKIYNMFGEIVYQTTSDANQIAINLHNEPNGVYLYRILREDGIIVSNGKFIIQ